MHKSLSISRAWEDSKARFAADGRLILTVALALIALPSAIGQFVTGGAAMGRAPQSLGEVLLVILVWLIGLVGQLAIVRLALGPSVSVGEAIAHAARRAPSYIGAVLLIVLVILLLSLPFVVALAALGVTFEPGAAPPPSAYLFLILFLVAMFFLAVRMLLTSPVASAEEAGPLAIIKRSWALTRGHGLRLFGFILLFVIGVIIAIGAISLLMGLIVSLLVGEIEPMTAAALLVALVEAVASAIATALFIVMLARIYVQLADGGATNAEVEPSVPSSGT